MSSDVKAQSESSRKLLSWRYPHYAHRYAFNEGYAHPGDLPEDWRYSSLSAMGEAFRDGQRQRDEDSGQP